MNHLGLCKVYQLIKTNTETDEINTHIKFGFTSRKLIKKHPYQIWL